MKKILILFIMILALPLMVNADMGAPMILEYKASINNPNGANYYEYSSNDYEIAGTLPYGTIITINYEWNNYGTFEYNDSSYSINIKDIIAITDEFDWNNEAVIKTNKKVEMTVWNANGIYMYEGPSYAYTKLKSIIPYGTKITPTYEIDCIYNHGYTWVYIEYNNTKGWICVLDGSVLIEEKANGITLRNSDITDNKGNVIGTIPANTIVNTNYCTDAWTGKCYVTYNNISGITDWSWNTGYIYEEISTHILLEKTALYTTAYEGDIILTIPQNSQIKVLAHNGYEMTYIEYNEKKGWVEDKSINRESNTESNESQEQSTDQEKETTPTFNVKQTILLCIGTAIISSLTAVVIILLVNKKKKI